MTINNELQNPLGLSFNQPTSNINPMQSNIAQNIEENKPEEGTNFALSNLLLGDEKQLTTAEQAKKSILEQVINKMFGGQNAELSHTNGMPLFPSVEFEMHNFVQEQNAEYNQQSMIQTPDGFLYESADEFYQKTTIDFSASAMINTPNGQYEIEINFQYTQEIYERHSTAISINHEYMANNPLEVNLDNDDYSLKDLHHIDLVFDVKKLEELEEERKKNEALMKFLQTLFENSEQEDKNKELQNNFFTEVAVYERQEESYQLAAQIQNGVGMYFSHEKSESAFAHASYDNNGNFSFSVGYSSYESAQFELKV